MGAFFSFENEEIAVQVALFRHGEVMHGSIDLSVQFLDKPNSGKHAQ